MKASGNEIIEQVLSVLEMKAPTFSSSIGVEYQRINDIQRKKTKKISGVVASAIVKKYPQFNINWLLTGEGEMLNKKPDDDNDSGKQETEGSLMSENDRLKELQEFLGFKSQS